VHSRPPGVARRRGRPLKFGRPAHSITITLPDDVLTALRARNRDIGAAIVALLAGASNAAPVKPAVVLHQTGRRSVIVVRPVAALRNIPGVDLVSIGDPDRALIALKDGLTPPVFELRVLDLLDGRPLPTDEAEVIAEVAAILRRVRRTAGRTLSEETIIVLEDARSPQARGIVRGRPAAQRPGSP
jgi:hypothetical protein